MCIAWYVYGSFSGIYLIIWRPQGVNPARFVLPLFISLAFICMPAMMLAHLKNNDGMAYPLGCFLGVIILGDILPSVMDEYIVVRLMFLIMMAAGAVLCGLSFRVWRRYFPDLRLFSAPRKDERGMYIFTDSAGHHAAPSARPRA